MTKQQIIETVKKLLALAGSPNEHEARLAMQRAQETIKKHSVSITEDTQDKIQEVQIPYTKLCMGSEQSGPRVMVPICQMFGVHMIRRRDNKVALFGFETNIKVALHACDCILHQLNAQLEFAYAKKRIFLGPNFIEDYWLAASCALRDRFAPETEIGMGLVLYDKAKEYCYSHYTVTPGQVAQFAGTPGINAGTKAGNEAQLRRGVESTNNEVKRIG